jgi:uncharacterized protein YndB with AHSA1/START domain
METTMSETTDIADRIERDIDINADAQQVWQLVSEPGWWINSGTIVAHEINRDGDVAIVHDPVNGEFRIRTEKLDAPRYVCFRWIWRGLVTEEEPEAAERSSTLVEFWIDDRPGGGVTLRVAESSLATLGFDEEERRRHVSENTEGWAIELAAAQAHLAPDGE